MIPILFDGTETDFAETSGLYLNDMISCKVTEERNGAYTATCVISTDDMWFSQIEEGKIILATVQGDIHDIGKNIVKVVLENYGYTVIDLNTGFEGWKDAGKPVETAGQ